MTPERVRERLSEIENRFDRERFYEALEYIHDDGQ